jgi:hypothetical protein
LSRFAPNFVDRRGVFILNFSSEIKIPRPQGQGIPEMISGHLALSLINEKTSERFF